MRHIPLSDTRHASILTFEEALRPGSGVQAGSDSAGDAFPDYDREAWIYAPDHYSEYRYILGTRGRRPLICVGVNPSTAVPGRLDNTLKSVQRVALGNGYDSFLMFNVYAQRATLPKDMDQELNPLLHAENMKAFRFLLSLAGDEPAIWAAWGAVIEVRPYLPRCVMEMVSLGREAGARWFTAGARSKAGHPHHPLYLKKDVSLDPFTDLDAYLSSLEQRLS